MASTNNMDSSVVYGRCEAKSPKKSTYQVILKPDHHLKGGTMVPEDDNGENLHRRASATTNQEDTGDYLQPIFSGPMNQEKYLHPISSGTTNEDYIHPKSSGTINQEDKRDYLHLISSGSSNQGDTGEYLHPISSGTINQEDKRVYLHLISSGSTKQEVTGEYLHPVSSGTTPQLHPGDRHVTPLPSPPCDAAAGYEEIDLYEEMMDIGGDKFHPTRGNSSQNRKMKSKAKKKRLFEIVGGTIGVIVLLSTVVLLMYFILPRDAISAPAQTVAVTPGWTPPIQFPPQSSPPQGVPVYSQAIRVNVYRNPGSGKYQLASPRGIAVTPNGFIWICDSLNNRIIVFNNQLEPVYEIDTDEQHPEDATFSNGLVYVTSPGTGQIHVYNQNMALHTVLGSPGSGLGHFNDPWGISSVDGRIYIIDERNDRIQVFDNRSWIQFGQGEFGRKGPKYVAISNNRTRLAVSDGQFNLYILDSDHHVSHRFMKGQPPLNISAWCLAFDRHDNLIVCDYTDDTIVVLDWDFKISARIGSQILNQPSGIALTQMGDIVVSDWQSDAIHLFKIPYHVP